MPYAAGVGQSILEQLAELPVEVRDELVAEMSAEERLALHTWAAEARPEQLGPPAEWTYWALMGGRGSGKTRAAAEWVCDRIEYAGASAIGFVGRTAGDVRRVMVEGESGFIRCAERRGMKVVYNPSRAQLSVVTQSGHEALVTTFSADQPDSLRGPQHDTLWGDEFAAWPRQADSVGNTALTNAQAGLRLGDHPKGIFTTTPRVTPEVKAIFEDKTGAWAMTRMTTWDNAANLAPSFIEVLRSQYEGTRLAAQEFEGLLVEEVEGALWHLASLDGSRVKPTDPQPLLIHRAVAVDPSIAFKGEGDECGIVAGGVGLDRRFYPTHDYSMRGDPDAWARRAVELYHATSAQVIVAEGNQGGALVATVIHNIDPNVRVEIVYASDGKRARAEPIAQLWEPGPDGTAARASIVGYWPDLETQLTGWSQLERESPDRLDALVWLGHWALERMFYMPAAFSARSGQRSAAQSLQGVASRPAPPKPAAPHGSRPSRAERLAKIRQQAGGRRRERLDARRQGLPPGRPPWGIK